MKNKIVIFNNNEAILRNMFYYSLNDKKILSNYV